MNVVARALRQSAGVRRPFRPATRHAASAPPFRRAYATPATPATASRKLDSLIDDLKLSADLPSIRHSYSALVAEVKNSNIEAATPRVDDNGSMASVLQSLAASGQPEDTRILEKLLTDLSPLLGIVPSKSLYTSILQSFIENGHEEQAHSFLLNIVQLQQNLSPDIEQFHLTLDSCNTMATFTNLITSLKHLNITPTSQTFTTIFYARARIAKLEKEIPTIKELSSLISSCVHQGLTYDPAVADILYDIYAANGRFALASAILDVYQSILNSKTPEAGFEGPVTSATDKSEAAHSSRQTASPEQSTRVTISNYTHALTNSLLSGNAEDAIRTYTEAMEAGVAPLENMISPFLKAVTRDPSAEEHLDKAIQVLRLLADSVVPIPSNSTSGPLPDRPYRPGLSIYHGLIRALCYAPNVEKYSEVIGNILDEMKSRGLPTNTSVCASAKIILDMRRTGGFKRSIDVYHECRPLLNEYGYVAVLKEYCRISFAGDLQLPLVTEFFSIVQDMRLGKVPITNVVYGTFLHAIAMTATRIRNLPGNMEMAERLVDSTRRVHDFLTLDASINPDATLWNQLMNTYQRLGCFAEACRLWEVMYLTGRYNQISVNIMLDACGYAHNLRVARSILAKLQRARFKIDLRNWNTWVECLCRCQRYDEATDVVVAKIGQHGYEPDLQSIQVLLKFAKKLPKELGDSICSRVEESLPHLWKRIPRESRNR